MKALVYTGPETLEFRDAPDPVANAGDALIEVAHVGICGSDMHAWAGHDERRPAPLILGHEAAGIVIAGPGVGGRVTVNGLYKTEVIRRRGPWRNLDAVEMITLEWIDWFNNRRLLGPVGNIPPAEAETTYYAQRGALDMVA